MITMQGLLDQEKLQALNDLAGDDRAFRAALLDEYRATIRTSLTAIYEALETGNAKARQFAAHTLKGSSLNIGALNVARLAAAIEHPTWQDVPSLADLEFACQQACDALAVALGLSPAEQAAEAPAPGSSCSASLTAS